MTRPKKKYKDTVFRLMYADKMRALSLYNSINGTEYNNPELLQYNTLENAIYMNVKNDLSFIIANQVNLYEQQSTPPVNMPLRDLFYVADVFQKMYMERSLYDSRLIKIPDPKFIVFYNGRAKMPEKIELKLSDSYFNKSEEPSLELKVTVFNINPGMNEELKEKCPSLKEYMIYVEKVKGYALKMKLEDAVEKAVEECVNENVLKEFLLSQKAEVVKMSIYEYNEAWELEQIKEGEREIGEQRMMLLNQRLLAEECIEDLRKASLDAEYRDKLYKKYGI